ncbi:hypothetical protein SCB49_10412 [unidentified eubacterium SCB49]|nr:hypothetical protein SCB49_10412 [unidentified eubacterium SCB49]
MKKILPIALMFFFASPVFSQVKAITVKGDTINVYENGTWENINSIKEPKMEVDSEVKATVKVDEFNNSKKILTELWTRFGETKTNKTISGYLIRVDDLTVFSIAYSGDLGCLSEYNSTMKVKLTNGEIIEFAQISDTDCGDYPTARFIPVTRDQMKNPTFKEIMNENLSLLKDYDWVTIRINGSEYYTDITPKVSRKMDKPEQFFRQHITSADRE